MSLKYCMKSHISTLMHTQINLCFIELTYDHLIWLFLACFKQQHKVRRRCLVFEMAGAHKKKSVCDSNSGSSISSQSDCEVAYVEKLLTPRTPVMGNALSMLSGRGIGLHLNSLATSSRDGKVLKIETLASGRQEISKWTIILFWSLDVWSWSC